MSVLGVIGEGLIELGLGAEGGGDELACGGDAANVCVMAARMGAEARLAGRVGDDGLGRRLLDFWQRQHVDLSAIRRDPDAATGLYINERTPAGDHRLTYWRRGSAGSRLTPNDLDPSFFADLGMLAFTGVTLAVSRSSASATEHAIAQARAHGARIACVVNHRPALGGDVEQLRTLAAASDILLVSSEEVAGVFGASDPRDLLALLEPRPTELVLTDGPRPAQLVYEDRLVTQPVPAVTASNAAGAGDAVAGAYLAARMAGQAPMIALRWGVAAATLSVTRPGCAASYPDRGETLALANGLARASTRRLTKRAAA